MSGWTVHAGPAVALPREGVDTDQLIPARFMTTPRSKGYGQYLLHDLKEAGGVPDLTGASVLVTKRNFGGGSSREAAVYALVDAGIRVVAAPSFGDIFMGNAVNNGLLPAQLDTSALLDALADGMRHAHVDLEAATISLGNHVLPFHLDDIARTKLANGWDDIDLTRAEADTISAHRAVVKGERAWIWPSGRGAR